MKKKLNPLQIYNKPFWLDIAELKQRFGDMDGITICGYDDGYQVVNDKDCPLSNEQIQDMMNVIGEQRDRAQKQITRMMLEIWTKETSK